MQINQSETEYYNMINTLFWELLNTLNPKP